MYSSNSSTNSNIGSICNSSHNRNYSNSSKNSKKSISILVTSITSLIVGIVRIKTVQILTIVSLVAVITIVFVPVIIKYIWFLAKKKTASKIILEFPTGNIEIAFMNTLVMSGIKWNQLQMVIIVIFPAILWNLQSLSKSETEKNCKEEKEGNSFYIVQQFLW